MEEEDTLSLRLHKLSTVASQEALDDILTTLWKTRRIGLRSPEKSRILSLLNLPSLSELDPVLACLRSLIRKTVHENLTEDDLLKLFPPDLSIALQSMLVLLLRKHQSQWTEEISRDEHPLPKNNDSCPVKTSVPSLFTSFSSIEPVQSIWPHQDDPNGCLNRNDPGTSTTIFSDTAASHSSSVSTTENLSILPRLISMTWTLENCTSPPANRMAIITLKLQDYTKSSSGETEVKFLLTKDTLEAMLRSLTYISKQLSSMIETSGPAQKKQKQ